MQLAITFVTHNFIYRYKKLLNSRNLNLEGISLGTSFGAIYLCYPGFYSILSTIVPGPKTPFAFKQFLFSAATMAQSGFAPNRDLWCMDAPRKHIIVTTTFGGMMHALGLGVLTPQPELYHTYGTEILR